MWKGGLPVVLALVTIGGLFAFDRYKDQSIENYIEESIQVRLGTNVDCESANHHIFNSFTVIDSCTIENHSDFESANFANISRIEIDYKQLISTEVIDINDLLLEGININLDVKSLPPSLNLQKMLSENKEFSSVSQVEENNKSFFIRQMRIENIQVSVFVPVIGKKTFQIEDIVLNNLHNENYKEEIRTALQKQVNSQIVSALGENAKIVAELLFKAINTFLI